MCSEEGGKRMANVNRVRIKKVIYEWAIKESQKDFEEIKEKFKNVESWITENSVPTFRQVQELANFLKVPLGYMFLSKPPEANVIESEFRSINNKIPDMSKNLKGTIFNMGRKQTWLSSHRMDKGWSKVVPEYFKKLDKEDIVSFSEKSKEFIKIDEFWYKGIKETRDAYNHLRKKIESQGIIVMQNGVVASNTHRKLDINEFRGFMLYDNLAPLIFVNANDSQAGKIFTLIHEYIHILFEKEDVFLNEDLSSVNTTEKSINEITAEFLMPKTHVLSCWNQNKENFAEIEKLSKELHVSKLALAIRLKDLSLAKQSLIDEVSAIMMEDLKNKKTAASGGDHYANHKSRYGESYIKTVIQGAEAGDISYTYAFNLLDAKASTYDYFKGNVVGYE